MTTNKANFPNFVFRNEVSDRKNIIAETQLNKIINLYFGGRYDYDTFESLRLMVVSAYPSVSLGLSRVSEVAVKQQNLMWLEQQIAKYILDYAPITEKGADTDIEFEVTTLYIHGVLRVQEQIADFRTKVMELLNAGSMPMYETNTVLPEAPAIINKFEEVCEKQSEIIKRYQEAIKNGTVKHQKFERCYFED